MEEVLVSISLIISIAALMTIIARLIKQPPIIAYLAAGILIGPMFLNFLNPTASASIELFARIGVAFLLFIVGLSLDLRVLKEVGIISIIVGVIEIIIVGGIGILVSMALRFTIIPAIYIGAALAFSSTVVVVKILSDKKEIDTLHGRIVLGVLIIQDFVAALALMLIPFSQSSADFAGIAGKFALAILLIMIVFLISRFILIRFLDYLARSQEALFLFGVAWMLVLATIFNELGFSLEIGALIAGMSLASSKYNLDLSGKMKPLRDFFVVLFFVFFGSQLVGVTWHLLELALVLSVVVILVKPLVLMFTLRAFGYSKRTNFLSGISLAQISEFSLIIAMLGFKLGHLSQDIVSLLVLVTVITITASGYGLYYSHFILDKVSRFLFLFEGRKPEKEKTNADYEVFLIGYHRVGYKILKELKKMKIKFLVVDYNPKVILALEKEGVNCVYGDASDKEFLSEIHLEKAKLVISTIPEENANLALIEKLDEINSKAVFLGTAEHSKDAIDLYKKGVDFVIVPHHLGGDYVAGMIGKFGKEKEKYKSEGKKHYAEILEGKKNSIYK